MIIPKTIEQARSLQAYLYRFAYNIGHLTQNEIENELLRLKSEFLILENTFNHEKQNQIGGSTVAASTANYSIDPGGRT